MGLLADTLRLAVPMWEMRMAEWPRDSLQSIASECAMVIAAQSDTLMFKGKSAQSRQMTRDTFNRMAQGLAILTMLVKDFELHTFLDEISRQEDEFFGDDPPGPAARVGNLASPAQHVQTALQQLVLPFAR